MPTITHCTEMLVHHFMRACVLLCHEYANPHCAQLWDQYRGIYDFEDRDLKQLDAIVEILNEEPTIGIGLGNGSSSSSSSQGLAVGGSTELPATPPSMESLDTTVEFRDVAFRRSTWPMKQVSSCGCVGGWVGWLVGSFVGTRFPFEHPLRVHKSHLTHQHTHHRANTPPPRRQRQRQRQRRRR